MDKVFITTIRLSPEDRGRLANLAEQLGTKNRSETILYAVAYLTDVLAGKAEPLPEVPKVKED